MYLNINVLIIVVRRSRTLDFKYSASNNVPIRSHSTTVVTTVTREASTNNPFEDSFVNGNSDHISGQTDKNMHSNFSSQQKKDSSTQVPLELIMNRPSSNSPTLSYNITQPDVTHLVSPRVSICSTPAMTGSEYGQEDEDPSSDESWGTKNVVKSCLLTIILFLLIL